MVRAHFRDMATLVRLEIFDEREKAAIAFKLSPPQPTRVNVKSNEAKAERIIGRNSPMVSEQAW